MKGATGETLAATTKTNNSTPCVSIFVPARPEPLVASCPWRYMGGDTQQLTEGHDTGVCLGRRQECGDPRESQRDARTTNQPSALFALAQASELIAATTREGSAQ